jgi:RsmE family RNA methyltransferase
VNRILFDATEMHADGTVELADHRARHLQEVLHVSDGDTVRVGQLDGPVGSGRVFIKSEGRVGLEVVFEGTAPEPWADLLLALPRPKVLKRLWPQLAALGVGRIVLLNAAKVERCYFGSHAVDPASYRPLLIEGLMQAGTTRVPEVLLRRRFRRFMEEELDGFAGNDLRLLAHPGPATPVPQALARGARPLLAVGPEGGWADYELDELQARGFQPFSLGSHTLRTDTACIALLAVLGHVSVAQACKQQA